jgi:hypothetical protein
MTPAYIGTSIESRGEESVVREQRFVEVKVEKVEQQEEIRVEPVDYSHIEREIEIMKIKGGIY